MQEAHRPPCSKYTVCCSGRGHHLPGGIPCWGYPLSRCGVTPAGSYSLPRWGLPLPQVRVPPAWIWEGSTPCLNLGRGTPISWMGVPSPPSRCGLTHKVKILPSLILRLWAVKNRPSVTCKWGCVPKTFHWDWVCSLGIKSGFGCWVWVPVLLDGQS